ncbi:ABC transporter ATP-binding protein [Kineococcus sp. SYSU DK006]|uniref:ABC transporter ATP-binding protein n=1 Tax=Kineococcus sp. SYSU DK006 TaxID=3383127 RepID=UPI003D7C877C
MSEQLDRNVGGQPDRRMGEQVEEQGRARPMVGMAGQSASSASTSAPASSAAAATLERQRAALSVRGLTGGFTGSSGAGPGGADYTPVLHDVTFDAPAGRLTAVVGETGSGKSITAMTILGIAPRTFQRTAGSIFFDGLDLTACTETQLRRIRGGRISIVFQDARAALNPVLTIGSQLSDVVRRHRRGTPRPAARQIVLDTLRQVQIPEPVRRYQQYPHEFSGGMAQRVMIAMALLCEPDVLILDEPTTGLDVTIQADVMELIVGLGRSRGLSTLLITHDMGVVAECADHVVVMRHGQVLEVADTEAIFHRPRHDYTRTLIASSRLEDR